MKIAVMADIHSNSVAFRRCVEYACQRSADIFFLLGDYIGELAYPQRTMDIVYELNENYTCYFIRGNKEEYWLKYRSGWNVDWRPGSSTTGILYYDYSHLRQKDLDFFAKMPCTRVVSIDGMPDITLCHGSPRNVKEGLRPGGQNTLEVLAADTSSLVLCAHTHIPMRVKHQDKRLINPGSVGRPLDGGRKAQFLFLEEQEGKWVEEFISLEYDVERAITQLYEENLDTIAPGWTKVTEASLLEGRVGHMAVLERVMELCRMGEGVCNWPDIPEKYWKTALQEYGIII